MPAHLFVEDGPLRGLVLEFSEGDEWVIGRDPDQADFVIEDSTVSRKHVLCKKTDEGIAIKNLSRVNPCAVNDEEIKGFHLLKENDRVRIGQNVFIFSTGALNEERVIRPKKKAKETDSAFDAIFDEEPPAEEALPEPPKEEIIEEPKEEIFEEILAEEPKEEEPPKKAAKKRMEEEAEPEKTAYDTIFEEGENYEELPFNLLGEASLILKVISGPNAGAEIGIQKNRTYVIGKDPATCDIVFQDLSVSRNHARLTIDAEGKAEIEDLGSKNGTLINGIPIQERKNITSQDLVALGTTTFLIIDRETESETIYSPLAAKYEEPTAAAAPKTEAEVTAKEAAIAAELEKIPWKKQIIPGKYLVGAGAFVVIFFIVFLSFFSLFKAQKMELAQKGQNELIKDAVDKFSDVQFSFNPASGKLFLVGHVLTGVEMQELMFRIDELPFVDSVENTVVIDEIVWKTMNDVLTENAGFRGVSIHSPQPGKFVLTGYLQTPDQLQQLNDYVMVNFPYLDRLDNQVVLDSNLTTQITSILQAKGFAGVTMQLTGGDLVLTGRYNESSASNYDAVLKDLRGIKGIRTVKNFAVPSNAASAMIDLTQNYQVTGFSLYDHQNYSVIVNGKIVTMGQNLDGMEVTEILPKTILLEKDGLKYKIDYSR